MAQTLTRILIHLVFSTKNRADLILPSFESDLYAYVGGICRNKHCPLLAINGTANHVHLLVVLGKVATIADLLMHVKKDSSKWMKTRGVAEFTWQEGYGAFSIGESGRENVVGYIRDQKTHHLTRSFEDEFIELLRRYNVGYDPKYIWS